MGKQQPQIPEKFHEAAEVTWSFLSLLRGPAVCALHTWPRLAQVEWRWVVTSERETEGRETPSPLDLSSLHLLMQGIPLTEGKGIHSIVRNVPNTGPKHAGISD